jgi:hypothetical protein
MFNGEPDTVRLIDYARQPHQRRCLQSETGPILLVKLVPRQIRWLNSLGRVQRDLYRRDIKRVWKLDFFKHFWLDEMCEPSKALRNRSQLPIYLVPGRDIARERGLVPFLQ